MNNHGITSSADSIGAPNDLARRSNAPLPASELVSNVAERPTANGHVSPSAIDADWGEPQPFYGTDEPIPYPIDALPKTIRAAVEEVHGFVQAPIELIALSAVGALALAGQAQVDVKRAEGLSGPTSLFLLGIADSGERKSMCDRLFTGAIEAWQKEQLIAAELELEKYRGEKDVWEAERKGLQQAIQLAAKNGEDSQEHSKKLEELHKQEPRQPHTPRILLADETPENLAYRLANDFPSGGVISAEGGLVLGAQAMKAESIMRHLSVLNIIWDGGSYSVGRRTSESFEVKQARLTVSIQLQETTLRAFQKTNGELARGIGFLARFLVCHPFSTQGSRMFVDPPAEWTQLNAFNSRITEILALPLPLDEDGLLRPIQSSFDKDAKASWISYHDTIERSLAAGQELCDLRDVASKSADNAARLAGLFELFEHGLRGKISAETIACACRIAAWHLNEARRWLLQNTKDDDLETARRLEDWLIRRCRQTGLSSVPKNYALQYGPKLLRSANKLNAALQLLENLSRVKLVQESQAIILLNPSLLGDTT